MAHEGCLDLTQLNLIEKDAMAKGVTPQSSALAQAGLPFIS